MIGEAIELGKQGAAVIKGITDFVDDLHLSEEEKAKFTIESDKAQVEINKIEAQSSSFFIAGWRPFVAWVCGVSLAYHYLITPFLTTLLSGIGYGHVRIPEIQMGMLLTLLGGLLGLGTIRSFDKIKGVDTRAILARNKVSRMSSEELRQEADKWSR